MASNMRVEGNETLYYGKEIIENVQANLHSPYEVKAKSVNRWISLIIRGKLNLGTEPGSSETIKLYEWSQESAASEDVYRKVEVEIGGPAGEIYRIITLPQAFVEDYQEKYQASRGVGHFTIVIRQKSNCIQNIKIENRR